MSEIKDVDAARKALGFFKVMAFVVGVGLLILVAEMVLRYGFDNHVLDWWPQPHGFIYIVYLVATANLGFKVGWSLGRRWCWSCWRASCRSCPSGPSAGSRVRPRRGWRRPAGSLCA